MGYGTISLSDLDTAHRREVRVSRNRSAATLALARMPVVETIFDGSLRTGSGSADPSAADPYHHFSGMAALVEALIDCDVRGIEERFEAVMASPDSIATLKSHFHKAIRVSCLDDEAIWSSISQSAACKPEVNAALSRMEASIAGRIGAILGLVRGLPDADATGSFATRARAICLIAEDALASHDLDDALDAAVTALVLCAIDWLLDDTLADLTDAST